MAGRGVLFALTKEQVKALLAAETDDEVMEVVETVEEAWDEAHLAELDKAWDAMHRALSDGSLDNDGGEAPLNLALLGGKHLYDGDDYVVTLVDADKVPDVAKALAAIDEAAFRERYFRLVPKDYAPEYGEEDLAYTWSNFADVVSLYAQAAREGRAVVFTVDQ
jgi:hypothetical protein